MWRWTALVGLSVLTCLLGLGRPAIQDADEAFYAEAGREMVASGDWITPRFNGAARLNKPVLFYWLIAIDDLALGTNETSARLWSALAGIGLALATAGVTRRWFGPGPDLVAGGIVATSLGLTRLARSALPDVPLACFVTLSIWAAFEAGRTDLPPGRRRWWVYLTAVTAALGLLTKGPVALALLVIVVGPALLWERWLTRRARVPTESPPEPRRATRWGDLAVAVGLAAAIAAPWFVIVTAANGPHVLKDFLVGENIDRFLTDRFNPPQPAWYYVPVIAAGLLPWSAFLALLAGPAISAIRRPARLSPAAARLVVWAIAPLLFFTASTGKQPRYIVPCLVPIAVVLGVDIWRRATAPRDGLLMAAGVGSGAITVLVGILAWRLGPILNAADPGWTPVGPIVLVLAGLTMAAASLVLRGARPLAWLAAAGATVLAVEASIFWPARPEPVERVAAAIDAQAPTGVVCSCGAFARNLGYYAHVRTVASNSAADVRSFLTSGGSGLAVVDEPTLTRLETQLARRFDRLLTVSYLDRARLRVGDVLRDSRPAAVARVVLVRAP